MNVSIIRRILGYVLLLEAVLLLLPFTVKSRALHILLFRQSVQESDF